MENLKKNVVAMYVLRGSNYILPLIYIPYLLSTIGLSEYGVLAFYLALCSLAIPVIEYGFNITGINDIIDKKNSSKVQEIYSEIFWIRILLSLILVPFIAVAAIVNINNTREVLIFTYLSVVAQSLFPTYIFQAMRQMSLIATINIMTKIGSIAMIFIFVKNPADAKYVPMLTMLGAICAASIGYIVISKKFKINIQAPKTAGFDAQFKRGGKIFMVNGSATLYNSIGPISLGVAGVPDSVGIYSLGEKILQATKGLYLPLLSGMYSYWVIAERDNDIEAKKKLKKILIGVMLIIITVVPLAAYFADLWLRESVDKSDVNVLLFFCLMLFVAPIDYIRNIFGNMVLIPRGGIDGYTKIMKTSAVFGAFLIFMLAALFGAIGAAVGLLAVELLATVLIVYTSMKVLND